MSKFQKRHYEAIAKVLNRAWLNDETAVFDVAVEVVAEMFEEDSRNFDFGKFSRAVYMKEV